MSHGVTVSHCDSTSCVESIHRNDGYAQRLFSFTLTAITFRDDFIAEIEPIQSALHRVFQKTIFTAHNQQLIILATKMANSRFLLRLSQLFSRREEAAKSLRDFVDRPTMREHLLTGVAAVGGFVCVGAVIVPQLLMLNQLRDMFQMHYHERPSVPNQSILDLVSEVRVFK